MRKKHLKEKGCRAEMIEGGRQGAWKGTSSIQSFLLSDLLQDIFFVPL